MSIQSQYPNLKPSLLLDFANTKRLDPRITFTRTTTARYYDGKTTAKAEENLFQKSEEFNDAYWSKTAITVTANAETAPNGTATADKLLVTLAGYRSVFRTETVVANASYTLSVFAKADVSSTLSLEIRGSSTTPDAEFDLTTGTVSSGSGTITAVGGGWYRCSITKTSVDASEIFIIGLGNSALLNDSIFLWGAQLEQRSAVTAYTPTTTQPITNYIPQLLTAAAGQARFDHNPVTGESLGLLIEEQRSNLLQRSEEFNNAYWDKSELTVTPNSAVAPDGTLSADQLVENTGLQFRIVSTGTLSVTFGASTTLSVYAKQNGRNVLLVYFSSGASAAGATFDLNTGTVLTREANNLAATITSAGNGWYRCSITVSPTSSTVVAAFLMSPTNFPTLNYTGDGYSGIYIWGAQLEAGAFPTSYIKTEGSTVTRNADAASMVGANFSSWYRADEGTLYAEAYSPKGGATGSNANHLFNINDPSLGDRIRVFRNTTKTQFAFEVRSGGTVYATIDSGSLADNVLVKIAGCIKTNDFAFSINGGAAGTDTSGLVPANPTRLEIGTQNQTSESNWNNTIKKIAYYPARLTNAQLQALTTV
jgi:hypothetical protein